MTQTVTALFDTRPEAEAALNKLVQAGIPRNTVRLLPGTSGETERTGGAYDQRRDEGGFWNSLKDLFIPDEDRYAYSEGLSRGGTMLSIKTSEDRAAQISELLDGAGAVQLDEREASWRKEGWSGYSATETQGTETQGTETQATETDGTETQGTSAAIRSQNGTVGRDESIPIVEERLQVGKRVTEGGQIRVRSYVTETPVQEQVTLRDESVQVERRPVDRAPTPADENLFAEKTIEATARGEQAVVSKDARVKEEISLRRDVSDRTETVNDTVRRTEVEVEDERGGVDRTGTTDRNR